MRGLASLLQSGLADKFVLKARKINKEIQVAPKVELTDSEPDSDI